ncbi:MAG: hypothetical protein WC074_04745 [bacterium]|jgi:hypothetical protein
MPGEYERDRERAKEEEAEERDRGERRAKEREREEQYYRSGFDWISFLLGFLLGMALLAVLWFFTGSQRISQGQAPQQIAYASRIWTAAGGLQKINDSEFIQVDTADGISIYVRRNQSRPYAIIYVKEGENTYQSYQPVAGSSGQQTGGGRTTTPSVQEPTAATPQDIAQQRANKLVKEVIINGQTWNKENLVSGENLDLERYGTYTVGSFNVYKEVQTAENMLNNIYVGVGAGMYVHYRKD